MLENHAARAHALLSASSAARWLACPASALAAAAYEDTGSEFAAEGTLAHEVAEAVARSYLENKPAPEFSEKKVTGEMLSCALDYTEYIQEQIKEPTASVLLEQRVDFSEWVPEGFGTCDCIIIQGTTLTIIDFKFGQGVSVSAKDNPQMKLYALGALNDYGFAYDVSDIEMHIFQPRINNISTDRLTIDELLTWANETVKPVAKKAIKGKGGYHAGAHCKFCPHAGRCRTLTKTCTDFVETKNIRTTVPVLAPHEIAEVLEMEPLIALWLKRVKTHALDTLLNGEEIPGYKVVEGKLGNRKWTDELKVAETLRTAGIGDEDFTETKLLSPAAMDKALGKKKVAELLDGLIDRSPGAPTVVPETDKRPAYSRLAEAQKDFN